MLQIRVIRVVIKQRVERRNTSRSAKLFVTKIDRARDSLVKDRDSSHDMRKAGLAAKMRIEAWITNIEHPSNSPNLNPIEDI